jgi:hypothetical protein
METKKKNQTEKSVVVPKTPAELQKMRLDKLMRNPVSISKCQNHCFQVRKSGIQSITLNQSQQNEEVETKFKICSEICKLEST